MKSKLRITNYLLLFSIVLVPFLSYGQTELHDIWWTPNKDGKIKMYLAKDGKTYGKIIWLSESHDEENIPKVDKQNPNPELRDKPLIGLILFKHFDYGGDNKWVDGEVYDPQSGKTYSCQMTLVSQNQLEVRGYLGLPMFGRTETFTRVEE